ncbi:MAG: hypothetical protein ACLPJH_02245 [Myxococcaceae bacterium]
MRKESCLTLIAVLGALGSPASWAQPAAAGDGGLAERVAAIKKSLAISQQNLRSYQWVQTTVVSLNGEEKSRKQESCYYGADGALQKVLIATTPPPAPKPGLRGKIVASKTAELSDTMKQAVALVHSYVPPDPLLIQRSKDAGKSSFEILQPGKVVRLVFRDYRMPGDLLGITLDMTSNQLLGLNVATYLGQPSSPVTMDARLAALADGTTYTADIQLAVKSAGITVAITNSGYVKRN